MYGIVAKWHVTSIVSHRIVWPKRVKMYRQRQYGACAKRKIWRNGNESKRSVMAWRLAASTKRAQMARHRSSGALAWHQQ